MSTATLNGLAIARGVVALPAWGIWWADLELAELVDGALEGAAALEVGGLELMGTIMSGGTWNGTSRARVAGGAGLWGTEVEPRAYSNDAGVSVAKVVGDAAADAGESLDASTATGNLGSGWTRERGPAARVLATVAPQGWYVGEDGTTRLGSRPQVTYGGDGTVVARDEAQGSLTIAADDLSELVPGVVIDGLVALDVVHVLEASRLRTRIYGSGVSDTSRLASALGRVVEQLTASLRFRGVWSYRVVAQSGERLDLQAERASSGMPDLLRVRVRLTPGIKYAHLAGSMVLVAFVDGDPSRPVVVAGDDPESPGFTPTAVDIDSVLAVGGITVGGGVLGVARQTDPVTAGPYSGTITTGSLKVLCG